jgi:hypothetical protein
MADLVPPIELELRIALLPPISRGANLGGPLLYAEQLVGIWKIDDGDDVPLAQAFRLLDAEAIAGAIWRTLNAKDQSSDVRYRHLPGLEDLLSEVRELPDSELVEGVIWRSLEVGKYHSDDPRYWYFPPLDDLLPELRELSWRAMLDGTLLAEAIKGVRGKRHRAVLPAELPRLTPDWELSRLCRGTSDEFIEVHVRRPPAEPVKKAWRKRPDKSALKAAMTGIARGYQPDAQPSLNEIWNALKGRLGPNVTRQQARDALKDYAPHLRGRPGYRSTKSPS